MNNKKIKLAVVGIGVMGLKHIDAINKVGNAELTAVVDFEESATIRKINCSYFPTINQMFKSKAVDGVIVATPNSSHFKDGIEVIKNELSFSLLPILVFQYP